MLGRVTPNHDHWMRLAIEEGDLARGTTGDNPWVGCVIVSADGELLGRGHTQGPGEHHAEIAAAAEAHAHGRSVVGATLYSTLEPCSFHGRTPACSRSIAARGIARVVIGMRDPNPRVDGEGISILREAGVQVVEGVCEGEIRRQLGIWVVEQHPHEVRRRAEALPVEERVARLAETYGVEAASLRALVLTLMIVLLVQCSGRSKEEDFIRRQSSAGGDAVGGAAGGSGAVGGTGNGREGAAGRSGGSHGGTSGGGGRTGAAIPELPLKAGFPATVYRFDSGCGGGMGYAGAGAGGSSSKAGQGGQAGE
jgi:diaminohydroxyphosphoribosylaminopyrimidine deaminase/5-amino-6-(5-phosphoribosylamino)uracil reductase